MGCVAADEGDIAARDCTDEGPLRTQHDKRASEPGCIVNPIPHASCTTVRLNSRSRAEHRPVQHGVDL